MSAVAAAHDVSKHYGNLTAVDNVSFVVKENAIYGLLGRNGAGKTTVMQILTGQGFASSGTVEVFGAMPYENPQALRKICFVKENQRYPRDFTVGHVLTAASMLYPSWDHRFAKSLLRDFQLRPRRPVRRLSRGMLSALGIIVGLASRAPLTLFDEPYLGLDAVARQLFYDRLLLDHARHPRTVLLSTHLIDEVSDLIAHVLLIDRGRILIDEAADTLRSSAMTVTGPPSVVDRFTADRRALHRERLGNLTRVTVDGSFGEQDQEFARPLGLDLEPVSLQQLIVRTTTDAAVDRGEVVP